ncbi:MAG: hypothetical protein K0Q78_1285 [Cellvibrio sp.]|nr:hypothetical protein [Cellvibrio sp.]
MIWELSQDAAGENSLLKVIDDEINQVSSASSSIAAASSVAASSIVSAVSSATASSVAAAGDKKSSGGSGSIGLIEMVLLSFSVLFLQIFTLVRVGK